MKKKQNNNTKEQKIQQNKECKNTQKMIGALHKYNKTDIIKYRKQKKCKIQEYKNTIQKYKKQEIQQYRTIQRNKIQNYKNTKTKKNTKLQKIQKNTRTPQLFEKYKNNTTI